MNAASLHAIGIPPGPAGLDALRVALAQALAGGAAVEPFAAEGGPVAATGASDLLLPDGIAAVVSTSGSTGHPRRVLLSREAIVHAAQALLDRAGGPAAWLVAMPVNHVGGLMVVARAILSDTPTYALSSLGGARSFTPDGFISESVAALDSAAAEGIGLRVSLVPTQLSRLVESPRALDVLSRFDRVLSGAAATPDAMADRLRSAGVRLLVSYGMSETAGGCVYDGVPLQGVDVTLDQSSRVIISGPVVAHGYLGEPEISGRAFQLDAGVRQHRTNDRGAWVGDRLVITGRTDDVVKVGGVAVSLQAVADVIDALPGVLDAVVLSRGDAEWGRVPVAFIVGDGITDESVRSAVRGALGRAAVPREIHRLEAIPLLPNGKVDRQELLAIAGALTED